MYLEGRGTTLFEEEKIRFSKPNVPLLRGKGYSCVDMHFHTRYSDGSSRVDTVKKKLKKRQIGVAITDHNEIKGSVKLIRSNGKLLVIPGIELSSSEGSHYLFYFNNVGDMQHFYKSHIIPAKDIHPHFALKISTDELLDLAQDYNCLTSVAHPYLPNFFGVLKNIRRGYVSKDVIKRFDAVEVINGNLLEKMNLKSVKMAYDLNKSYTGGTDGHVTRALGKVLTCAHAETPEAFLDEIRRKRNIVVGKESMLISKTWPTVLATRHNLRHQFNGYWHYKAKHWNERFVKYHARQIRETLSALKEKI